MSSAPPELSTLQYEPLEGVDGFRLLHIHPASNLHDTIEVSVERFSLDTAPTYTALSYVCGDQNVRENIKVNGHEFSVTSNLFAALRQMGKFVEPGSIMYLWIDAICIDQSNTVERSQQIGLMGRIFGDAIGVKAWLGTNDRNTNSAIDLILTWSKAPQEDLDNDLQDFLSENPKLFDEDAWDGVQFLVARHPWWSRMWTYQEFVLAQHVLFLCGDRIFDEAHLIHAALTWLQLDNSASQVRLSTAQRILLRKLNLTALMSSISHRSYRRRAREDLDFLTNVFSFQNLQYYLHARDCTDPRDKLYSLLALQEDSKKSILIEPGYDKSVADVYTDFVVKSIQSTSSLSLLAMSGIGIGQQYDDEKLDLPSWVPDFRASSRWASELQDLSLSPHRTRQPVGSRNFPDPGVLRVDGVTCDIVTHALNSTDIYRDGWAEFVRDLNPTHPAKIPPIQAYVRSLACDRSDSRHPNDFASEIQKKDFFDVALGFICHIAYMTLNSLADSFPDEGYRKRFSSIRVDVSICLLFFIWCLGWEQLTGMKDNEILLAPFTGDSESAQYLKILHLIEDENFVLRGSAYINKFAAAIDRTTVARKLFTTKEGYLGLGPELMEEGDLLCYLFGCDIPLILRKKDDHYLKVGQCYVYGMMAGEVTDDVQTGKRQTQIFELR